MVSVWHLWNESPFGFSIQDLKFSKTRIKVSISYLHSLNLLMLPKPSPMLSTFLPVHSPSRQDIRINGTANGSKSGICINCWIIISLNKTARRCGSFVRHLDKSLRFSFHSMYIKHFHPSLETISLPYQTSIPELVMLVMLIVMVAVVPHRGISSSPSKQQFLLRANRCISNTDTYK